MFALTRNCHRIYRRPFCTKIAPEKHTGIHLYLVTNDKYAADVHQMCFKIKQFYLGGGDVVQVRFQQQRTRQHIELVKLLAQDVFQWAVEGTKPPLQIVVNDHPDVAFYAGLKNVHLGPYDASPADAKKLLGADSEISYTINTYKDLIDANRDENISKLGIQMFRSHNSYPESTSGWGLEGLKEIRLACNKPVIAIGGLNEGNIDAVLSLLQLGDAVAFAGGILGEKDIIATTQRIREKIDARVRELIALKE